MRSRTYEVGRSSITLRFGDITESKAEVLVSSDDTMLSMGGGVSAALRRAGGSRVAADASKLVPAQVGDVLVSSAGDLPAKYILHAVTLGFRPGEPPPAAVVRQASQRAMYLLRALGCRSIAFPSIGTGVAGFPRETVAAEMATALVGAVIEADTAYRVELFLMDRFRAMGEDDFFVFFEQFAARQLGVATLSALAGQALLAPAAASPAMDAEQASQAQRRHGIYTMLRHLDARRDKLEAELVQALRGSEAPHPDALAALESQLEQIRSLRHGYEAELDPGASAQPHPNRGSVFVSSTSTDLQPYRQAARGAIEGLKLRFVGMEDFGGHEQAPANLIRQKVNACETYLGIFGMRYGYVDAVTGLSMTELEYQQALASVKPLHLFVMDDTALITAGMVETDSARFGRLQEFKSRITKDHTCVKFTGPDDLAGKVRASLAARQEH
jgi:O-acetyl-ADP-ribose deacetylase (regulator of RNase III)